MPDETQAIQKTEDKIFSLLFDQDELTWQTIILELIKTEQMDPWDVDVSTIAERFIELLSEMKKMDFRISGKIILAAAFFLKIKSDKLVKEDIAYLDQLIKPIESQEDLMNLIDNLPLTEEQRQREKNQLVLRSPQPRKRKVSVYDLINALERAMNVEQRRTFFRLPAKTKMKIPERKKSMDTMINEIFKKIQKALETIKQVKFTELTPSPSKEDKITTFVPLLYLDTQRKIDINQKEHFGEILINLAKPQLQPEPN